MKHAQLSVEFFLIASFIVALAVILINNATGQIEDITSLQRASQCKAALDSATGAINIVAASGDGAKMSSTVYLPKGSFCFMIDRSAGQPRLQCDAGPSVEVKINGRPLAAQGVEFDAQCPPNGILDGWVSLTATNNNGVVAVTCRAG